MTDIIQLREQCLSLPEVTESFPFDEETLVFKVLGKMFALVPLEKEEAMIWLKCAPELAFSLREHFDGVQPIFNEKYWNLVYTQRDIPARCVAQMIRHSYYCVVAKMPKRIISEHPLVKEVQNVTIEF